MARFFGQYLLEKGILSREQLLEALARQRSKVEKIGELAVRQGYLKENDIEKIRREQQHTDLFFGQMAVKLGYLTESQVAELLNIQRSNHVYLGEVIADLGYLTREQIEEELKIFRHEEEFDEKVIALAISREYPYQNILNAIADMTQKHFRRVADMLVKVSNVIEEKGSTENPYLSVFIELKGDLKGLLLLKMSEEAAVHVVKEFGGDELQLSPNLAVANLNTVTNAVIVKDAVGEFFNILCGNLLTKLMELGKSCDISVPRTIVRKEKEMLEIGKGKVAYTLPLSTQVGFASVSFIPEDF